MGSAGRPVMPNPGFHSPHHAVSLTVGTGADVVVFSTTGIILLLKPTQFPVPFPIKNGEPGGDTIYHSGLLQRKTLGNRLDFSLVHQSSVLVIRIVTFNKIIITGLGFTAFLVKNLKSGVVVTPISPHSQLEILDQESCK